jgi:thioredoxin-like negative regulator of GroEL
VAPIVDGLEEQYGDQVAVKRINADLGQGPAVMKEYRILGHPTLLVFDQTGREVDRLLGPQPADQVEELLQQTLTGSSS